MWLYLVVPFVQDTESSNEISVILQVSFFYQILNLNLSIFIFIFLWQEDTLYIVQQAWVVQTLDSTIHRINHFPAYKY